ncbi:DMT family transporter [Pelistega europaea]|uniref:DMT family transporter n=1 Tax=Pelistega europaea TaxID=106147 RepID=A0A7Y4LAU6_9BURK|nr:DMT family transporter [Pelistega europaea]NOL50124.1 DMT family transporter [Pelistega europaea]
MIAVLLGILMGICVSVQVVINTHLRTHIQSPLLASLISFTVGTSLLFLLLLVLGDAVIPSMEQWQTTPWWFWIGGLLGAGWITINIFVFLQLGPIQTSIFPVLGQIVMGVIIDHFGLFKTPEKPISLLQLIGVLCVLTGIMIAVAWPLLKQKLTKKEAAQPVLMPTESHPSPQQQPATTDASVIGCRKASDLSFHQPTTSTVPQSDVVKSHHAPSIPTAMVLAQSANPWTAWIWRLLAIGGGVMIAMQTAINTQLNIALGSKIQASFISFFVGAVSLFIVALLKDRRFHNIANACGKNRPWWIWMGGALGAFFVAMSVVLVPILGVGQLLVLVLLGQLMGSICIEQFGLLGLPRRPLQIAQLTGLLLLIFGVVIIRLLA